MHKYKVLELFSGKQSFSKVARTLGFETFNIDLANLPGQSLVKDINKLLISDIPFYPDIIWISFPCTTYSIMGLFKHRNGIKPKSVLAKQHDRLFLKVIHILQYFPAAVFFIENPRGMLRKMPFMQCFDRTTVSYCQYGFKYQKPTDIWSNNLQSLFNPDGWKALQICTPGSSCHEPAPRGSSSGLRSINSYYEKCSIPSKLCSSILISCLTKFNKSEIKSLKQKEVPCFIQP